MQVVFNVYVVIFIKGDMQYDQVIYKAALNGVKQCEKSNSSRCTLCSWYYLTWMPASNIQTLFSINIMHLMREKTAL